MNGNIIAYRIGEKLFCRDCYEGNSNLLFKDSGVTLSGKPITDEDIELFICGDCKAVKGPAGDSNNDQEKEVSVKSWPTDAFSLRDLIEDCASKVNFLSAVRCGHQDKSEGLNRKERFGLYWILTDLEKELDFVVDHMSVKPVAGVEKEGKKEPKAMASSAPN